MIPDAEVERALVVTAHPDDVDFGAAGTIAGWTDAGIAVSYCIVTNGDAGGFDPATPRNQIAGIRQREQTAAAKSVGVTDLHFLGYPDGMLECSMNLRRDISRVIRQVRPQRLLIQSPVRNFDRLFASHPDHLAAGEAAMCALYPDSRNPFVFTELIDEGFEAWAVPETWIMATEKPNHFVDTTVNFDRKIEALRAHESQHQDPDAMAQRVRGWNELLATTAGFPEGHTAESFVVLDTK